MPPDKLVPLPGVVEGPPEPFAWAIEVLQEAVAELQEFLGDGAEVRLESGLGGGLGIEILVVVKVPSINYREVIFRALIAPSGKPARLDFFGTERLPSCATAAELSAAISTQFGSEDNQSHLAMLYRLARQSAVR